MKKINMVVFLATAILCVSCRMDELEGRLAVSTVSLTNPELQWSVDTYSATFGEDADLPALTNPYDVPVTLSSSNPDVATISESGEIVICGCGQTVISATSSSTSTCEASSASYTLVVKKGKMGLSWSAASCSVKIGSEGNTYPVLANPNDAEITYSSSDESVAVISKDGTVTLKAEGSTVITASSAATSVYDADEDSYALTVTSDDAVKMDAGLEWSAASVTATYGETVIPPVLSNPNNLQVTYSSRDEDIVSVSPDGTITILSAGVTTIIATTQADDTFNSCSVFYKIEISKADVELSWSESVCTAVMEQENEFPVLDNPKGVEIAYASSNESVATVSATGEITLLSNGTTQITASSVETATHNPASAVYTLYVKDGSDEGSGTYTYPSTGDTSSDDDIVNTTFTRKITITYSTSGNASVTGDYYGYVSISGNDVTVNDTGSEYIVYELNGSTTDGYLKLYSSNRQALLMNGVSIAHKSGAAVNIQSKKRTFVMIEGTNTLSDGSSYSETVSGEDEKAAFFSEGQLVFSGSGTLTVNATGKAGITSDDYIRVMNSPTISTTSSAGHAMRGLEAIRIDAGNIAAKTSADMKKGFSSDSLVVINGGTTTITVTGGTAYDSEEADYTSSAGVKADKLFYMNGGSLTITNSGSGGKGISVGSSDTTNDCKAYFTGGTIDITCTGAYNTTAESGSKGIKVGKKFSSSSLTGDMYVSGGTITVRSTGSNSSRDSGNEAVESKGVIEVTGGELFAISTSDDAINAASDFTVTDGYVCGISTGNDGLDSNGNFYIKGGVVMAASAGSPEVGIDANSEGGKKLYVQGGVLFVTGGLESGASLTQSCYKVSSFSKGTWYALTVGSKTYAFKTHASAAGSSLIVSGSQTPTLKSGITVSGGTTYFDGYANRDGSYGGGSSVSLSSYSGGSSSGPGGNRPF